MQPGSLLAPKKSCSKKTRKVNTKHAWTSSSGSIYARHSTRTNNKAASSQLDTVSLLSAATSYPQAHVHMSLKLSIEKPLSGSHSSFKFFLGAVACLTRSAAPLLGRVSCGADYRTCARRGFSEREYNKRRGV
jgi:hypothetical protein